MNLKGLDTVDKVEQTITLTLQEIDQNIAACHKLTLSIYSLLNQYNQLRRQMLMVNSNWFLFFNHLQPGLNQQIEESTMQIQSAQNSFVQNSFIQNSFVEHVSIPDEPAQTFDSPISKGETSEKFMYDSPVLKLSERTYSLINQLSKTEANSSFDVSFADKLNQC